MEKRAEHYLVLVESKKVRDRLPSTKLETFIERGIVYNAGRFDEHETFRCKDAEIDLPLKDNLDISPVALVVLVTLRYFRPIYCMSTSRPHSGIGS